MTWVKICGTTNLDDALLAVDAGADAVGFVFYEKSPRNVSVETVREIVAKLPESVEKVGVFVRHTAQQAAAITELVGLGAIQIYPLADGESSTLIRDILQLNGHRIFLALPGERLESEEGFGFFVSHDLANKVSALFLDSVASQGPGGTGKTFNWKRAASGAQALSQSFPLVVAGGLTSANVTDAIHLLAPWGVDVVSGVEASPGKKDPEKVRAFVRAVREYDRKAG